MIRRQLYVLANNGRTKFADWVAYVVVAGVSGPERNRRWLADPDLPADETLEPADYARAHPELGVDRGHQAPLASFALSPHWAETNYLSNATPQNSNLNRGRWARLERAERLLAEREHASVYVITGPLYEAPMRALPSADEPATVPSGYWKVVAVTDGRVAGFIFANAPGDESYCSDQRAVEEIESRSGLDLFPDASGIDQAPLATALGC